MYTYVIGSCMYIWLLLAGHNDYIDESAKLHAWYVIGQIASFPINTARKQPTICARMMHPSKAVHKI